MGELSRGGYRKIVGRAHDLNRIPCQKPATTERKEEGFLPVCKGGTPPPRDREKSRRRKLGNCLLRVQGKMITKAIKKRGYIKFARGKKKIKNGEGQKRCPNPETRKHEDTILQKTSPKRKGIKRKNNIRKRKKRQQAPMPTIGGVQERGAQVVD